MVEQDWFVDNDGLIQKEINHEEIDGDQPPYRLYRFLTELENVLNQITDDALRLQAIVPLVRKLLNNADWLHLIPLEPDPETGWAVSMLYDEPFFPLTIQLVAWAPGITSPIHNHATWGLVAILSGEEKNTIWRRSPTAQQPDRIEISDHCLLNSGDVLCLMPDAIHQIEAIGDQPTVSFNLYGETQYDRRLEFDPEQNTAKVF
jgi:predicted metal-dependent enzyme (double-stranded beta helix superfamily)